jgi:Cu/Ag efflux protein CusF
MKKLSCLVACVLATALAVPSFAQQGAVVAGKAPGMAGVAHTANVQAKITKIDQKTREITLKGPQGNELTVTAGPEVKNFAKLKAGDTVDVQYLESLVLELKKGGGMPVERTEERMAKSAKPGETPGAAGGRRVTVVGDVIDVDTAANKVTVKGPKRTVVLDVTDPEQLKMIAKGDQVQATYTEAAAVSVMPSK